VGYTQGGVGRPIYQSGVGRHIYPGGTGRWHTRVVQGGDIPGWCRRSTYPGGVGEVHTRVVQVWHTRVVQVWHTRVVIRVVHTRVIIRVVHTRVLFPGCERFPGFYACFMPVLCSSSRIFSLILPVIPAYSLPKPGKSPMKPSKPGNNLQTRE